MLKHEQYQTKWGLPVNAYGIIDNLAVLPDKSMRFDLRIQATKEINQGMTPQGEAIKYEALAILPFVLPYQFTKDLEYSNTDTLYSAIEQWLLTATIPADRGEGVQEYKVLEGNWVIE